MGPGPIYSEKWDVDSDKNGPTKDRMDVSSRRIVVAVFVAQYVLVIQDVCYSEI